VYPKPPFPAFFYKEGALRKGVIMENKTPVYMLGCQQPRNTAPHETDWIETFTGKRFYPFEPNPADIDIQDITHALSLICRYNGHCDHFYSVAQHSVLVSELVPKQYALDGLLHDAAEAYIGDIPPPIKKELPKFQEAERRLEVLIAEVFGVSFPIPAVVKTADSALLAAESIQLGMQKRSGWYLPVAAASVTIDFWDAEYAERRFHERYIELRVKGL